MPHFLIFLFFSTYLFNFFNTIFQIDNLFLTIFNILPI